MLSVIVPVYNAKKFLPRCLDSLLNQGVEDYEIICVNDGSTDGSLEILNSYVERYTKQATQKTCKSEPRLNLSPISK